ncbi:hypothetical protein L211DRAFT_837834 [Terfezia boudieri ATCC MYA-4762]|uniref:Uncharacterized protein n=1 Tax=Terfezia boudieri ATCC MYA-4762 TaxID=1051890 RepID=A0A3N4LMD4_9PEZI|nr:hypothetical protein L211DRAFT_837834 [Terfezia boudieri ATCC MYA-4762]
MYATPVVDSTDTDGLGVGRRLMIDFYEMLIATIPAEAASTPSFEGLGPTRLHPPPTDSTSTTHVTYTIAPSHRHSPLNTVSTISLPPSPKNTSSSSAATPASSASSASSSARIKSSPQTVTGAYVPPYRRTWLRIKSRGSSCGEATMGKR